MGKGRVKITNLWIHDALKFPNNWKIESIKPSTDPFDIHYPFSEMIISGPDFPEMNYNEKIKIKNCKITYDISFHNRIIRMKILKFLKKIFKIKEIGDFKENIFWKVKEIS